MSLLLLNLLPFQHQVKIALCAEAFKYLSQYDWPGVFLSIVGQVFLVNSLLWLLLSFNLYYVIKNILILNALFIVFCYFYTCKTTQKALATGGI